MSMPSDDKVPFRHTWWVDFSAGAAAAVAAGGVGVPLRAYPLWQWLAEMATLASVALGLTQFYAVKHWGHAWRCPPQIGDRT
jgi:hypothetical protein